MNALFCLLLGMLVSQPIWAQGDSVQREHKNIVRRSAVDHDEEIMYYGKHNEYFTVRVFLKNGALFRQDSYSILPKTLAGGIQLDSVSRILRHGPTKIMYPTGQTRISCEYKDNSLNGPFMVLYEDGAVKRREYYRNGRLTRSQCYTPDGEKQNCIPFYQAAQFLGKPTDLSTYLKQKFGLLIDDERIRRITATLSINEIGQVTRVGVVVNADPSANTRMPDAVSYAQQVIRNMPEWTPEKFNWKPAMNDGIAIPSTCFLTVFRIYGTMQYRLNYQL
ncbi:toxin-antitoxin system YwqK family antitoxin [Spirosoma flavum]|uniref:Toxin-antitoxin system YwqK family antitoxin n=1 Tax=Spirosoma flavum TaxID=2048557 RepID=A0ABW6AHS7_9BACT